MAILRSLLANNISLEVASSASFIDVFKLFDENYVLPSPEEFKGNIYRLACIKTVEDNHSKQHANIMSILTLSEDSDRDKTFFAVSLVYTMDKKYIPVNTFYSNGAEEDLKAEIFGFIDQSVESVMNSYGTAIKYVIFDGKISLPSYRELNGMKYFLISCMSVLPNILRNDHPPFPAGYQYFNESKNYYDSIDSFEELINSRNCTLADAFDKVFSIAVACHEKLHVSILKPILSYVSHAAFAANYFDPKYKGARFEKAAELKVFMTRFLSKALPLAAFDQFHEYQKNTGYFLYLKQDENSFAGDWREFWSCAKLHYQELGNFVLNLLEIPPVAKKIDLQKLKKIHHSLDPNDTDAEKAYKYSLVI